MARTYVLGLGNVLMGDDGFGPSVVRAFTERYEAELDANPGPVDQLRELGETHPVVTLLVGARDPELNQGVVLERYLEHHPR